MVHATHPVPFTNKRWLPGPRRRGQGERPYNSASMRGSCSRSGGGRPPGRATCL